jgi:glycosyltransferase involved in cell wall biosynthesis
MGRLEHKGREGEMIRVAYFIDHLRTGGAQKHLVELLRGLDHQRFSASVWTQKTGGELTDEIEHMGVRVRSLDVQRSLTEGRTLVRLLQIAQALRREGVHIAHGYLYAGNILGSLAGLLGGVPVRIVSKRSLDSYRSRAKLWACRLANKLADRVTVNAGAVGAFVEQEEGCRQDKMVLIPNGVDCSRLQQSDKGMRSALGISAGDLVVGTVGRLTWKKAPECLLAAAQMILQEEPQARLLVVGDGPLRAQTEKRAEELGIHTRCLFTGSVSDAAPFIRACDVFVLSSVIEGMANALLEALACGKAAVVTDAGGNSEVVQHGKTGFVVPRNDPHRLAQATLHLLRHPDLAFQMGEAARQDIQERFGLTRMVQRVEALYDTLLREKAVRL